MTAAEVTELIRCSGPTLLRLERRDPTFPAPWRNGRLVRYRRAAVEAYLAAPAPEAPTPAWESTPKPSGMPDYLRPTRKAG